jgi:hypothetical protein
MYCDVRVLLADAAGEGILAIPESAVAQTVGEQHRPRA